MCLVLPLPGQTLVKIVWWQMFEGEQLKANVQANSWMHLVCQALVVNKGQTEHVREHTWKHAHISALTLWAHGVGHFPANPSTKQTPSVLSKPQHTNPMSVCQLFAHYLPQSACEQMRLS